MTQRWDVTVEHAYHLGHGPLPAQTEVIGAVNEISDPRDVVVFAPGRPRSVDDLDPGARVGTVWLFDPQAITRQPQRLWWNPLGSVTSAEQATRLADHFIQSERLGDLANALGEDGDGVR
mgnify:CR=1 FL=1